MGCREFGVPQLTEWIASTGNIIDGVVTNVWESLHRDETARRDYQGGRHGVGGLGWAAGMSLVSFGRRIGIRTTDPSLLDRLEAVLPPEVKPGRPGDVECLYSLVAAGTERRGKVRRVNLLYGDEVPLTRSKKLEVVMEVLESDLQLHVAEWARGRVFVHAGVVGWRGRAILIPGSSRSGKTTLVRALVEAGATYYSDEYAVLDLRGRVHPYRKAISVRDARGRTTKIDPEALGGPVGARPLPVGLVVATSYRAGATWRPRRQSPGRAVMELLAHTVSARRKPERALTTLRLATSGALVIKGVRGDAETMVESLLSKAAAHEPSAA